MCLMEDTVSPHVYNCFLPWTGYCFLSWMGIRLSSPPGDSRRNHTALECQYTFVAFTSPVLMWYNADSMPNNCKCSLPHSYLQLLLHTPAPRTSRSRRSARTEPHGLAHLLLSLPNRFLRHQHIYRRHSLRRQRNHARARNTPDIDAHAAERCAGERQDPFNVVGYPAGWYPEHGGLGEPELEDEAETLGPEPAERGDGGCEGCLVAAEGVI